MLIFMFFCSFGACGFVLVNCNSGNGRWRPYPDVQLFLGLVSHGYQWIQFNNHMSSLMTHISMAISWKACSSCPFQHSWISFFGAVGSSPVGSNMYSWMSRVNQLISCHRVSEHIVPFLPLPVALSPGSTESPAHFRCQRYMLSDWNSSPIVFCWRVIEVMLLVPQRLTKSTPVLCIKFKYAEDLGADKQLNVCDSSQLFLFHEDLATVWISCDLLLLPFGWVLYQKAPRSLYQLGLID